MSMRKYPTNISLSNYVIAEAKVAQCGDKVLFLKCSCRLANREAKVWG
jgi:hypothetical protein